MKIFKILVMVGLVGVGMIGIGVCEESKDADVKLQQQTKKKIVVPFERDRQIGLSASEPTVSGGWSVPVNGLRGRLLFAEDTPFNGTRIAVVYIELQNVSDVLNPLLVDSNSPRLDLIDADGKSIRQSPSVASIFTVPPYTLVLPFDSTIRFRVSVSGYGISKDSGVALPLNSGFWVISPDTKGERFLTGSFAVPELGPTEIESRRKDLARGNCVWRGTLILPKLKIPLSAPK